MQIKETIISFSATFSDYDWRAPESQKFKLDDDQKSQLDELVKNLNVTQEKLDASELKTLFKIGAFFMHDSTNKQVDKAMAVLDFVHTELNRDETKKAEFVKDGTYNLLNNNLAFALVNNSASTKQDLHKARNHLQKIFANSDDREVTAFAERIAGQSYFAESNLTVIYDEKRALINKGIANCLNGIEGLDVTDPKKLSEVARTHNRNAVEVMKLVNGAPVGLKQPIVDEAMEHALKAQSMWDKHDPEFKFVEFRARNSQNIGEIHAKKYELTENKINLNSAMFYLEKAEYLFSKKGNDTVVAEIQEQLKPLKELAAPYQIIKR